MYDDYYGHLALEITNSCNLRCRICEIWKEKPKYLSKNDIKNIILCLGRRFKQTGKKYRPLVTLTGGEPFLHPEFSDIYRMVWDYRKGGVVGDIYIISNGFFTERVLDFLKKNDRRFEGLRLDISLDGLEKTHNFLRGKDSFRNIMKTITSVREMYPRVVMSIKMTLNNRNYRDLPDVYEICKKYNLMLRFLVMAPVPNGYYNRNADFSQREGLLLNGRERKEVIGIIRKICDDLGEEKRDFIVGGLQHLYAVLKNLGPGKIDRCTSPIKEIFINSHGYIYPCIYANPIANVHEKGFEKKVFSPEHKKIIEKSLRRECPMKEYHCNFSKITSSSLY